MDLSKYLTLFVAESSEHLAGFSRDLVRLEKLAGEGGSPTEAIDSLFRHAHSVKGMSGSMQLDGIARVAHRVEDLVDVFRKEPSRLDTGAFDLLLASGDALQAMIGAAAAGQNPAPDEDLLRRLTEALKNLSAPSIPSAGPRSGPETRDAPKADPDPVRAAAPPAPAAPPPPPAPPATSARAAEGGSRRKVTAVVQIAGHSPVPAVRAFLVLKKLSSLGTVLASSPTADDLRAGRIPQKALEVELETSEALQTIERALSQISDIAGVTLSAAEPPAPAPAAPAPAAAAGGPAAKPDADAARTVRVRTEILDGFLDTVGELILATARIREVGKIVPEDAKPVLEESVDRLHAIVKDLHDKVMAVRMTPLALVTERLPRTARDVARKLGKQVDVDVKGSEIEMDRAILEELSDPLLHVLRNAIDHGVEPPHLRLLSGKSATGKIQVHARRDRDRVIIEVDDDGKGMDPGKLRAAAVARGTLSPDQAANLSDREALMLACLPGVSTAETVTDVSGRGVGLDAVKKSIETIGGTIELDSVRGAGSRVTFRLPLTVAVQPVLLVRVGEEVLGLPIAKVHGAVEVQLSKLDRTRGEPVFPYAGELVPVQDLTRLLGLPGDGKDARAVVITEGADGRIGLAVDGLLGQQEAVLKPLSQPLDLVPGLSAVTVLGSGRPVFILDVPHLGAA
ncbi:MAG: chemotaxis protein CheA [Anaeromyxobacteraceae bacterium]